MGKLFLLFLLMLLASVLSMGMDMGSEMNNITSELSNFKKLPGDWKQVRLNENYILSWIADQDFQILQVRVQCKTLGWIGLGLGEPTSGSMPGSDMLTLTYENDFPVVHDRYVLDFVTPKIDSCQDWKMLGWQIDPVSGWTDLVAERSFDTGDAQDRVVLAGKNKVVFAYGLNDQKTLVYHETRRGAMEVTFYQGDVPPEDPFPGEAYHDYLMGGFEVPTTETNYICKAWEIPIPRDAPDYHIIRIDPLIDPNFPELKHHILVHVCDNTNPLSHVALYLDQPGRCFSPIGNPVAGCTNLLYGWAMGGGPVPLPEEAGFRMGWNNPKAFKYLVIEMHYDNPNHVSGVIDNTGFRIHYTSQLRKYDASSLTLGDVFIQFPDIPPQTEFVGYESTCPSECTRRLPHDINVFTSSAHMHKIGAMQWTTQYRDEQFLQTTNRAEFFQFDFQQQTLLNFVIKPGDRLNTHCVYNSRDRTRRTGFGMGSQKEMCMDFLGYYPRVEVDEGVFAYCGYFSKESTVCGSMNFRDSIFPIPNPIASDFEETKNKTFGIPCDN